MYRAAERFGFKGGRVLEPACGIGHFIGLMPEEMLRRSTEMCIRDSNQMVALDEPKMFRIMPVFRSGRARRVENHVPVFISCLLYTSRCV